MAASEKELITPDIIQEAMSYNAFQNLIDKCISKGKTTGTMQSDELTEYTRLNRQRMKRLDKTSELNDSLKEKLQNMEEDLIWLVLAEGWCGDVAQSLPVINKMAETTSNIDLKILLRTENTDIMDQYLTNGGRSIPKLVCLQASSLQELGTWGPRPAKFQQQAMKWKEDPEVSHEEWAEKLHKWYARDKTQSIQADFEKMIDKWSSKK